MAKIIEINNAGSFILLSGGGSLLRVFDRINRNINISTPLEGECIVEGLYIRAREERLRKRYEDAQRMDADSLLSDALAFNTRRERITISYGNEPWGFERKKDGRAKDIKKRGKSVYLINGIGGLLYDKIDRYRELMEKESDLIDGSCTIYVMRGRNDDARLFEGGTLDFPNVKLISDYTVLKFDNGVHCLCVGGAVSMNRSWLKSVGKYNDNEAPVFNRKELDEAFNKCEGINCLVTGFPNHEMRKRVLFGDKWYKVDRGLKDDVNGAEKSIGSIMDYITYKGCDMFMWSIGNASSNYHGTSKYGWSISSTIVGSANFVHAFDTYAIYMEKRKKAEKEREKSKQSKEMKRSQKYSHFEPYTQAISIPRGYSIRGFAPTFTAASDLSASSTLDDRIQSIHASARDLADTMTTTLSDRLQSIHISARDLADTMTTTASSANEAFTVNAVNVVPDMLAF